MTINTTEIKNEITKKNNLPLVVIFLLIVIFFLFSSICFFAGKKSVRRTYIFPSAENGKYIIEYRNLSKHPHQGDIQYFIEEMLLGSTVERTKFLFKPGTKLLSCFERNGVLYINLSPDLLEMGDGVVEIKEGINLLKKNIKSNFPKINSIEIFIDGKSAFEK